MRSAAQRQQAKGLGELNKRLSNGCVPNLALLGIAANRKQANRSIFTKGDKNEKAVLSVRFSSLQGQEPPGCLARLAKATVKGSRSRFPFHHPDVCPFSFAASATTGGASVRASA